MKSAKLTGPDARIRASGRSASVKIARDARRSGAPAGRTGWADLRRQRRVVAVERNFFRRLPRARDHELLFREDGAAETPVRRELEVGSFAKRTVRANFDAVAAVDAPRDVEL